MVLAIYDDSALENLSEDELITHEADVYHYLTKIRGLRHYKFGDKHTE